MATLAQELSDQRGQVLAATHRSAISITAMRQDRYLRSSGIPSFGDLGEIGIRAQEHLGG
jgi:hypothetical protein